MDEPLNEWFAREILVFERALRRYIASVWPDPAEVGDLCQDTLVRVYETAAKALPLSPRGLLFTTYGGRNVPEAWALCRQAVRTPRFGRVA